MVPPASGLGWQTSAAKRALAAPRVTIASRRPAGPDKSTLSSLAASGFEPGCAGVNVVVIPRYILRPLAVQFHLCATCGSGSSVLHKKQVLKLWIVDSEGAGGFNPWKECQSC